MKILFCGTMVPEEIEWQEKNISAAGNRFQNNMIANLEDMGNEVIKCSYIGVCISEETKQTLCTGDISKSEYYILKNEKPLQSIMQYREQVLKLIDDVEAVICYNIIYAWLLLPVWGRKKKKECIAIIADYSESISYRSILRKIYAWLQLWSMRQFDIIVGLSSNIENKLREKQNFILLEGGIDRKLYDKFKFCPHAAGTPIIFMYAGLLSRVTGVDILLEAMRNIDREDIRLFITGKGPLLEEVKKMAEADRRIFYRGHLPYNEYLEQLQSVNILINPRNMNMPENQNNFPSKVLDYLAAGKVIVSTRFMGWKKFEENILFSDSTAEALKVCMEDAIEKLDNEAIVYSQNRDKAGGFEWKKQLIKVLEKIERKLGYKVSETSR